MKTSPKTAKTFCAEFTEVYQIEADFKAKVESEFSKMIEGTVKGAA